MRNASFSPRLVRDIGGDYEITIPYHTMNGSGGGGGTGRTAAVLWGGQRRASCHVLLPPFWCIVEAFVVDLSRRGFGGLRGGQAVPKSTNQLAIYCSLL